MNLANQLIYIQCLKEPLREEKTKQNVKLFKHFRNYKTLNNHKFIFI